MKYKESSFSDEATLIGDDDTSPLLPSPRTAHQGRSTQRQRSILHLWVLIVIVCLALTCFAAYMGSNSKSAKAEVVIPYSIAVIGAGPAGVAAASTIAELAAKENIAVNITIYEQTKAVGGRLVPTHDGNGSVVFPHDDTSRTAVSDQSFLDAEDVAGTSLTYSSTLLCNCAKSMSTPPQFVESNLEIGINDGNHFVFETSFPSSALSWKRYLSQIYKFGASVWRATKLPLGTAGKFKKIRDLASSPLNRYLSVENIVDALGLRSETILMGRERLRKNGISSTYTDKVLNPLVYSLLGQSAGQVTDLALSLALDGVDEGSAKVGGRLSQILENMARRSGAKLSFNMRFLGGRYEEVSEGVWKTILQMQRQDDTSQLESLNRSQVIPASVEDIVHVQADKVILAAPWNPTSSPPTGNGTVNTAMVDYLPVHVTFFTTPRKLSASAFGSNRDLPGRIVLSGGPLALVHGIREISLVKTIPRPMEGRPESLILEEPEFEVLYRVVSTCRLDIKTLYPLIDPSYEDEERYDPNKLVSWIHRQYIKNAYPIIYPRTSFPSFELDNSFWRTSVVENVASTIDMAFFAGQNAGRLLMKSLLEDKKLRKPRRK